ncbi:uncharacterized protein LOC127287497 isoform X1 [Leptopilina boulardi]|uniref:uncharacterized protein LOC127287497 isoform X1 n=1 Tax=Leptopilina boulardi TaxID=63433 RepID=UPI0021F62A32|nr:uncharacterized protein LOC127287497 isoform X1 [Leptopilina boulardi]XP_051170427.1 uncharacterized protein LOC127287497 isoform X1 [Leptopilina boulardi]XP_051170428.1 uncharacterized protein LOC127287497 isoform X1 [Leptopilina boulardi]XP_051170429.1 uncharacterized protein LOC127287497 isoform X1 [Leptopilina boulardi]XP_051170430.1 uncharacterized protein LOC127287497 isoform X1 [Leptopilina boulardi]
MALPDPASWQTARTAMETAFKSSLTTPWELWTQADPLGSGVVLLVTLIFTVFILSLLTSNYSHVDRLWSLLPVFWVANYARFLIGTHTIDARVMIMLACVIIWGARLTFNFWRKGGYELKSEDYRWAVLKEKLIPYGVWQLFNFFFIALFQCVLIVLFSMPIDVAYRARGTPLNQCDYFATVCFLGFVLVESIADQQQWNFQTEKHDMLKKGEHLCGEFAHGFLHSGLFKYSRHPNFFSEISIWWAFYLFSYAASEYIINWTIAGPILLTLLFQGSTNFTEQISLSKYPTYALYQKSTSKLIPMWPGEPLLNHETNLKQLIKNNKEKYVSKKTIGSSKSTKDQKKTSPKSK